MAGHRAQALRIWTTTRLNNILVGFGYTLAALALALAGMRALVPPVSVELRVGTAATARSPSAAIGSRELAPVSSPALGGLAADIFWLQTHQSWVARDLERTQAGLRRTVAANPRPLAFWLNGARMMAYDMSEWRIARTGWSIASATTRGRINRDQAQQALAWLDRALEFHPHEPAIFIERALIQLYRLHDFAAAADSFKQASEQPGAPFYAARLHFLLLQRPRFSTAAQG